MSFGKLSVADPDKNEPRCGVTFVHVGHLSKRRTRDSCACSTDGRPRDLEASIRFYLGRPSFV
jgi:hypothetical protein